MFRVLGIYNFGLRLRICKLFEITRQIYSNSESSEQFLVTEFLTCSWRFLISNKLEQLELKLELLGFRNMQEKLENGISKQKFTKCLAGEKKYLGM